MKNANLGDYLLWEGKPAKVIGETDQRQVIIELLEDAKCPHCGGGLGKDQTHVIVSSPMFQNGAEQMKTIQDDVNPVCHICDNPYSYIYTKDHYQKDCDC